MPRTKGALNKRRRESDERAACNTCKLKGYKCYMIALEHINKNPPFKTKPLWYHIDRHCLPVDWEMRRMNAILPINTQKYEKAKSDSHNGIGDLRELQGASASRSNTG